VPTTLTPDLAAALARAEDILVHGVDAVDAPPSGLVHSVAADTIHWLSTTSLDQSRKGAQFYGGVGPTKELELEAAGIFEAYAANWRICVTSRSIARYRIANAILSHDHDGSRLKIRQPKARFKKQRRESTPQELAALKRANDARAEGKQRRLLEDKQRREAKVAARV
jgi:hypothetical protein